MSRPMCNSEAHVVHLNLVFVRTVVIMYGYLLSCLDLDYIGIWTVATCGYLCEDNFHQNSSSTHHMHHNKLSLKGKDTTA